MKKILFAILFGFGMFFATNVNALSAPDATTPGFFFANGTAIVISERADGEKGAIITWDEGSFTASETIAIVGGGKAGTSFDSSNITMNGGEVKFIYGGGLGNTTTSADVTTTNVVVNGGKVTTIYGGGFLSSKVTTSNVTINGGSYSEVSGGGAASSASGSVSTAADAINSPCRVNVANVTINGGYSTDYSYGLVFGGGQGYSYTGEANVTITGGDLSNAWITSGGANGYTGNATLEISGGKLNVVQGINRGTTDASKIEVTGGTITNLYVGGEIDAGVTGVANSIAVEINGGTVATVTAGKNNNSVIENLNEEGSTNNIAYVDGTVTNDSTGAKAYKVIIADMVNGSVAATVSIVDGKQVANLVITPSEGYVLDTLTANGVAISGTSVELDSDETTISATFKVDQSKDDSNAKNPYTYVNNSGLYVVFAIMLASLLAITVKLVKKEEN